MNRILYDSDELSEGRLLLRDSRADHIRKVLKSKPGDSLRLGEIDGPLAEGRILIVDDQRVEMEITQGERPRRPSLDLLLALPRPKVLKRLLPQISALGVDRLFLTNAAKVERFYFDSHVLDPSFMRNALVEGLIQCGDTCLPRVKVLWSFPEFFETPLAGHQCWLLHPGAEKSLLTAPVTGPRQLLAIGPEGGWRETEVKRFREAGFESVNLGKRILRSDTACICALGMAAAKGERYGRS
ncbi:MAG: RsmE family RNA methyltransferase [Kiritimatiellia bacterium]